MKELPALSENQLEIMDVVWKRGEATLGDIWGELSQDRPVAKNTIQTLLSRLVDKGWLTTRSEGKIFHYSATRMRESTLANVVQKLVDTAFKGSTEGLVMALLDGREISKVEADRIRGMIERAERGEA
ncbi:MAG: BlaI/MecI/CopY family transcriptional regulator [Fimbriimonadaceae bacterium]|nr:BlaI/MecI/CopY family transcriptional regulator [Fimbriimonadaceae bacterium]